MEQAPLSVGPTVYETAEELYADLLSRLDARLSTLVRRARRAGDGQVGQLLPGLVVTGTEVDRLLDGSDRCRLCDGADESFPGLWDGLAESVAASRSIARRLALDLLRERFGLTGFEVDCVVACLAVEIDRKYERVYAYLNDDVSRRYPSVGLLLELGGARGRDMLECRRRLASQGLLLRARLLERVEEARGPAAMTPLGGCLKLDEGIASFLLKTDAPFSALEPVWDYPSQPPEALALWRSNALNERVEALLEDFLRTSRRTGEPLVCLLAGGEGSGRRYAIEAACARRDLEVVAIDCRRLLLESDVDLALRRCFRDSILHGAPLLLSHCEVLTETAEGQARLRSLLPRLARERGWILFLTSTAPGEFARWFGAGRYVEITAAQPSLGERSTQWRELIDARLSLDPAPAHALAEELAAKFRLTPGHIAEAFHHTLEDPEARSQPPDWSALLHRHAGRLAAPTLGRLAQLLKPLYRWDDIVLPEPKLDLLRDVVRHVRHRRKVMEQWCFASTLSRGKGINVLFHGPSGAGKTMAAEIIGNELGMGLFRVDLAAVVSKYVGETEKNLGRIFDEARNADAVLFFDEAEALFGKRSEVRDAHDRYANIEINYLLQRMEEFEGIAILASNLRQNLDEAFLRRLRLVIEFPLPGPGERQRIWRKVLPQGAPVESSVDFRFLAQSFDLTGGSIRNVALAAAFLAAEADGAIGMGHLLRATEKELEKLGRRTFREQFGSYAPMLDRREPAAPHS